ncbi:DUF5787 family protein [Halomarina oriensis]|uniref:Uncharacterized protein n=1 Tax=Halomarina oriensis TaxID=671145 RepID=A0A6B0GP20_9EURY|nr:DUF5787 family protein [Halomarina oriensis]MWG35269.1 hypothetical protein [Halomarina oriensis]
MASPEFTFELRVCQWTEREWTPGTGRDGSDSAVLVARQLGIRERRWDTLVVECDPEGLAARAVFGTDRLDSDLLHVVRNAPKEWAYYREALPDPGYPWRYVREAIHTADDRGIVETRRAGNRIEIRRNWHYPDWVRRIVAIENKPDLDASAARALGDQLERDVALALADEVWVATAATGDSAERSSAGSRHSSCSGERVEPALFERLPVEVGILTVTPGGNGERTRVDTAWEPSSLAVDDPGTRIVDRPDGGPNDESAARFEYADPEWKRAKRLEIAERAYERGWRSYVDTMRTDCRQFELRDDGDTLPWCAAKGHSPTGRECSGSCPEFTPEPPQWRTRGWPIEGGPGKGLKRLLERQRQRQRDP